MTDEVPDPRGRRLLTIGAVLLVLALFLPFLGVPFEYDDKVEILQNRVLRHPDELREMWAYNPFRVLLLYTFAFDVWAWGFRVAPYRLENIGIHAANVALLATFLWGAAARLLPDASGPARRLFAVAGTLFFAAHPLAIESVTYVSGRSSSLATTFVLASVLAYDRYLSLARDTSAGAWLSARIQRLNALLGSLLLAGLAGGLPLALRVRGGSTDAVAALGTGAAITGVIWIGLAAVGAGRWRAMAPPRVEPDVVARGRAASRWYVLSFVAFVAGCLTKEIAATLPALLMLLEATTSADGWRAAFRALRGRLFAFFAIPLFLIALRVATYGYIASPKLIRPWGDNLLTQIEVVARYVRLWIVPFPQSIYHDHPVVQAPGQPLTWALAVAAVVAIVLTVRVTRRAPALAFGILAVAVTLAPTSSVFALKETMVEHRTYLPSLGAAVVAGWLVASVLVPRAGIRVAIVALGLWVAALGVAHVAYDSLWRSQERLWRNAVALNPESVDGWRYLGDLYVGEGRFEDAIGAFGRASRLRPLDAELLAKLGHAHAIAGRIDDAVPFFEQAIARDGCQTSALNNLARIKLLRGDATRAVELYTDSLDCDEENYPARRGLGDIYYSVVRDEQKAAWHYSKALEVLDPVSPDARVLKDRLMELTW